MSPISSAVLALVLCLLLCPVTLWVLRHRAVLDVPSGRSLHVVPTPRGGGLAPAVAGLAAIWAAGDLGAYRNGLLLAAGGCALLGLADDLYAVRSGIRLIFQSLIAAASSVWLAGELPWPAVPAIALLLISYVNAFNFMDGINGISAAQALAAGLTWAAIGAFSDIPALVALGLILAALAVAFAPFNFPRAAFFLGDTGSYFFGALLAGTVAVGIGMGVRPEAMVAPLAIYLADTSLTLLRRARRRQNLMTAHREHTYQRLAGMGVPHVRIVLLVLVLMALLGGLGFTSLRASPGGRVAAVSLMAVVVAGYLSLPRLFARRALLGPDI